MEKVRFGIVGCGNMGSGHAVTLTEGKISNGILTAVCDINPKKLEFMKEKFGDTIKYFLNAEEMYASGECDVVIICTREYARKCIEQTRKSCICALSLDFSLHPTRRMLWPQSNRAVSTEFSPVVKSISLGIMQAWVCIFTLTWEILLYVLLKMKICYMAYLVLMLNY